MARLKNIHPGEILSEEFLKPLGISAYRLSKDIGIPQTRTSMIIPGNRRITALTALRLAKYFGTSAKFWLGLQNDYDLEEEPGKLGRDPKGVGLVIDIAVLYTGMGDIDLAFHYLEKAITNRIGSIMMFRGDPLLTPLAVDSRFEQMIELVGEVPELDF